MPTVTKNLLIINILMYAASHVLLKYGVNLNSLLGLHFFMASDFRLHQFVTYLFMHGSLEHIFFNMFALWMFGRIIEQVMGPKRFLIYYMVCGVGAGVIQELAQYIHFLAIMSDFPMSAAIGTPQMADALNVWNTVGASGAIYGVLLAFGMIFPEERMFIFPLPIPIKSKYFVVGYAVIELLSALMRSNDQVAHMAHLGGMLFGFLLLLHWRRPGGLGKSIRDWWKRFRKPRVKVYRGSRFADEMDYNERENAFQEEIDRILDKVKRHGYGSLTEEEKRKLFEASGK